MQKDPRVHYAHDYARGTAFGHLLEPGDTIKPGDLMLRPGSGVWEEAVWSLVFDKVDDQDQYRFVRPPKEVSTGDLQEAAEGRKDKIREELPLHVENYGHLGVEYTVQTFRRDYPGYLEPEVRAVISEAITDGILEVDPDDALVVCSDPDPEEEPVKWEVHLDPHQPYAFTLSKTTAAPPDPDNLEAWVVMLQTQDQQEDGLFPVRAFLDPDQAFSWAAGLAGAKGFRPAGSSWEGRIGEKIEVIKIPLGLPREEMD